MEKGRVEDRRKGGRKEGIEERKEGKEKERKKGREI
jgi:hypothetical protein